MTDRQQSEPPAGNLPTVIVATSQVVRGGVGGRSAVFSLERLGFRVCFLPTILLPWHPGHGLATRIVPDPDDFAALVEDLIGAPWLGEVGAVLTGYLGAAHQARPLAELVAAVRVRNEDAIHLCDPVIGDGKALYVPPETAQAQKTHLVSGADIVAPNLFELGWLTGRPVDTEAATLSAARSMDSARVLVSSSPALRRGSIATLLATPKGAHVAEHNELPAVPHGTGDLLAALFLAQVLQKADDETALARSVSGTFELAARSAKARSDELMLADFQQALVRPMAMVTTRRIAERQLRV